MCQVERRGGGMRATARAAHACMGVQQQGKRSRGSHISQGISATAAGAGRRSSVQRKVKIYWGAAEVEELSKAVLGFKVKNGRLPALAMDKDFWAACYESFRGRFTHQQVRNKIAHLKLRYRQLSCGHAKSVKLAEREAFNIWYLIMLPPSPPHQAPSPHDVHDGSRTPSCSHHVRPSYATPVQRNVDEINRSVDPTTDSSAQFVHDIEDDKQASAASTESGGAVHNLGSKNGTAVGEVSKINEEAASGRRDDAAGGYGVGDKQEAAASTCSSDGSTRRHSSKRQAHTQFRYYENEYAAFNGEEHVQRQHHESTIADLAATTKMLAQATLSAANTTSVLANTTHRLAQALVSYGPPPGTYI